MNKNDNISNITQEELWDLDVAISNYIFPRLIEFKKGAIYSHPSNLSNNEKWIEIIDKMIYSFKMKSTRQRLDEEEKEKCKEGICLFAEYFDHLWI